MIVLPADLGFVLGNLTWVWCEEEGVEASMSHVNPDDCEGAELLSSSPDPLVALDSLES